jgi:hypothetical protein
MVGRLLLAAVRVEVSPDWCLAWSSKPVWGASVSRVGSIPIHLRHLVRRARRYYPVGSGGEEVRLR